VAHIYDENAHREQRSTVTDTKQQFGAGVAHIYDKNNNRARTGSPFHVPPDLSISISFYQHRQIP
jgi:hypothetical protein